MRRHGEFDRQMKVFMKLRGKELSQRIAAVLAAVLLAGAAAGCSTPKPADPAYMFPLASPENSAAAGEASETDETLAQMAAENAEAQAEETGAETSAAESTSEEGASAAVEEAQAAQEQKPEITELTAESGTLWIESLETDVDAEKIILKLPETLSARGIYGEESGALKEEAIPADAYEIETLKIGNMNKEPAALYLSDERGNPSAEDSPYLTIDLGAGNGAHMFVTDPVTMHNVWTDLMQVELSVVFRNVLRVRIDENLAGNRLAECAELFSERGEYSGEYKNPMTGETEELQLSYAAYAPEAFENDGAENPLIIWLHGAGEGGTDPEIALLGNPVTRLAQEKIQSYFESETEDGETAKGAYVLVPQTQTYWMDAGDGKNHIGNQDSRYTQILLDLIDQFLEEHPDVDEDRIILTGCSNGGYMTMALMIARPKQWAAAVPVCEAYSYSARDTSDFEKRFMTRDKVLAICRIPCWFIHCAEDTTVPPGYYSIAAYRAFLEGGADNCWYSMLSEMTGENGKKLDGHFAWVPFLGDRVSGVQNIAQIRDAGYAKDSKMEGRITTDGFEPGETGGDEYAEMGGERFTSVFAWMNAQRR